MGGWKLLKCLFLYIVYIKVLIGSDRENDSRIRITENPFRMKKLNLLWEKALKMVKSEDELIGFYGDFVVQDEIEFKYKKEKDAGEDEDGVQESLLRKKLFAILAKYGLGRIYPEDLPLGAKKGLEDLDEIYFDAIRKDAKLAYLWKQASNIGFTDEEMKVLKIEFAHHLEKFQEYEQLRSRDDIRDNSIPTEIKVTQKNDELKIAFKALKTSYDRISTKLGDVVTQQSDFIKDDHRVAQLWQLAQKLNFSQEELHLFKEELNHFNRRIHKHLYLYREAEIAKLKKDHNEEASNSWSRLDEKAKRQAKKVKKWHYELKSKLSKFSQHTEL